MKVWSKIRPIALLLFLTPSVWAQSPESDLIHLVQNQGEDQIHALERLQKLEESGALPLGPIAADPSEAPVDSDQLKGLWKESAQETLGEVFSLDERLMKEWDRVRQEQVALSEKEFKANWASK